LRTSGEQYASTKGSPSSHRQLAAALALLIAAACGIVISLASTHVAVPFANLALPGAVVAYALAVGRLIWVSLTENAATRRSHHVEVGDVVHGLAEELSQPLCAITANADAVSRLLEREQPDLAEMRAALADIVGDVDRISETLRQAQQINYKNARK
jgi:hypothetical protein